MAALWGWSGGSKRRASAAGDTLGDGDSSKAGQVQAQTIHPRTSNKKAGSGIRVPSQAIDK